MCGYAVDWLRSCYSSTWRLFKDSEVSTRGYYYFVSDDTPFYPGEHNLGSLNWVSDEYEPPPDLGEVKGVRRPWRNGSLPITFPPAVRIGSADCIAEGDRFPLGVIARTLLAGVDSRCWPIPPGVDGGGEVDGGGVVSPVGGGERDGAGYLAVSRAGLLLGDRSTTFDPGIRAGLLLGDRSATFDPGIRAGLLLGDRSRAPIAYRCLVCLTGEYVEWDLTISGATGDFSVCNGTWRFLQDASVPCTWNAVDPAAASILSRMVGASWRVGFTVGGFGGIYDSDPPTLDCLGAFSMTKTSQSGGTGAMPTNVAFSPVT